jgi:hypothetical protein
MSYKFTTIITKEGKWCIAYCFELRVVKLAQIEEKRFWGQGLINFCL